MSQPRVTEYFTRRKKNISAEVKPAARFSGLEKTCSSIRAPPAASKNKDLCSSPVRQEFVRVIDEAVGLHDGAFIVNDKNSPRTPKRTSDVFPATTDASPAKKKQMDANNDNDPKKVTKKKSRKKLVLPDAPPVNGSIPVS